MPRYLKRWSRWCQQAFFLLVRCWCSLARELSALSYSHSALDVWSWSSLRMSSKHSILLPWMQWGSNHSVGHYLDLGSAVLGLTLFPIGYLLHALTKRHA